MKIYASSWRFLLLHQAATWNILCLNVLYIKPTPLFVISFPCPYSGHFPLCVVFLAAVVTSKSWVSELS